MEDIFNLLKGKPSVDVGEEIEFYLARIDHRANQKFYRFF